MKIVSALMLQLFFSCAILVPIQENSLDPSSGLPAIISSLRLLLAEQNKTKVVNVTSSSSDSVYNAGSILPIQVVFSKEVTLSGSAVLRFKNSSGTINDAVYKSGSGTAVLSFDYTVQTGDDSPDLNYAGTDSLVISGTLVDLEGKSVNTVLPEPGTSSSLSGQKNLVVDTGAPAITSVTSSIANGTYGAGVTIPIQIVFSEPVYVSSGVPTLNLNSSAIASYASGSGTNILTFNYTIAQGQSASPLDYVNTSSLVLDGATIQDSIPNAATTTLPSLGASSLGGTKNIVVDAPVPITVFFGSNTGFTAEGSGSINIQVDISKIVGFDVVVDYSVTGGTATSGDDFNPISGTLTILNGSTKGNITGVTALSDVLPEGSETVIITLSNPRGGAVVLGANSSYTLTITDP